MPGGGSLSRGATLTSLGGSVAVLSSLGAKKRQYLFEPENRRTQKRVTVGYEQSTGERAAREHAQDVIYEFAFDALTVIVAEQDIAELR